MIPKKPWLATLLLSYVFCTPLQSVAADDAVILMYHHVAADTPKSTSVTPDKFKQHLQFLEENNFTIWPLSKIVTRLSTGKPVPNKTVAITFDDAYKSVYEYAYPLLKARGWPYTLFVTTKYVNENYSNYMTWEQLRDIEKNGAEIANHSHTHPHLIRRKEAETKAQWYKRIAYEVETAQSILNNNVNKPVRLFAYPFGEYSKEVKQVLFDLGYIALGQHSGVASTHSDFQAIPRFPIATGFDDMENFAIKVSARDLPVQVLSPDDGVLSSEDLTPSLTLLLKPGDYQTSGLACYGSRQGQIAIEWLDKSRSRLTVTANKPISAGRTKYNCTAPSASERGVFYWFSYLWMKPTKNGNWYNE